MSAFKESGRQPEKLQPPSKALKPVEPNQRHSLKESDNKLRETQQKAQQQANEEQEELRLQENLRVMAAQPLRVVLTKMGTQEDVVPTTFSIAATRGTTIKELRALTAESFSLSEMVAKRVKFIRRNGGVLMTTFEKELVCEELFVMGIETWP